MIATQDHVADQDARNAPTDAQRWAHNLVLDMLKANLPLPALAAHLNIPFDTLRQYLRLPEVRAEIDAYEELVNLRARLLGQTARPISLRRLLDVLESPAPRPVGRDPEADQRTLHRHAELIRRTATTIARESRALAPTPSPKPSPKLSAKSSAKPAPTPDPAPRPSPQAADAGDRNPSRVPPDLHQHAQTREPAPAHHPEPTDLASEQTTDTGSSPQGGNRRDPAPRHTTPAPDEHEPARRPDPTQDAHLHARARDHPAPPRAAVAI